MKKILKILAFATAASFPGFSAWAAPDVPCHGRRYSAKILAVFARAARAEVDLGFGMIYRGVVELDGALDPPNPGLDRYVKASDALRAKIGGKVVTLCVVNGDGKMAYFFVDGENVNKWMLKKGFLEYRPFPPIGMKF